MTDFSKEKQYIFIGSISSIERKMEKDFELNELGYFIKFIDVYNHGDIYEKGKAEFEYGFVNFPYYDKVEIKE